MDFDKIFNKTIFKKYNNYINSNYIILIKDKLKNLIELINKEIENNEELIEYINSINIESTKNHKKNKKNIKNIILNPEDIKYYIQTKIEIINNNEYLLDENGFIYENKNEYNIIGKIIFSDNNEEDNLIKWFNN